MKKRLLVIALALIAVLCLASIVACKPAQNTVSFEIGINGYTGEGVASQTIETGSTLTLPAAPEIEYYEFEYWQLGSEHYATGDTYTVATDGDIAFTAVYAETFTLTYSVANGQTAPQSVSGKVGEEVTLANGSNNGYSEFKGWVIGNTEYKAGAKYTPVHGANAVTALYTDTFVLSYVVEGGQAPVAATGKVGEEVTLVAGPQKADYKFEGWVIGGTLHKAGTKYSPALGATAATAQYELTHAYVTFEIEENSGIEGELGDKVRIAVGNTLQASDIPELSATKEFNGVAWFKGNDEVDLSKLAIKNDITVTAKSVYVGTNADAFMFTAVKDENEETIGYTVMASESYADYVTNGRLGIPAEHEGLPVVGITAGTSNEFAFGNTAAADLEYVYIPASVKTIGNYAFCLNSTLTTVIYDKDTQLETIGSYAFQGCKQLVTFSASVEQSGIRIPATVKTLQAGCFYTVSDNGRELNVYFATNNSALTSIGQYAFASTSYGNVNKAKRGGIILQTAIPESVTTIGNYAFFANPLNYIDFGENSQLQSIGDAAFSMMTLTGANNASEVTEIIIPKSVTSIGQQAFRNHPNIEKIEFEPGSAITEIKTYTFYALPELNTLTLPTGLTTLGEYAFGNSFDGTVNFGGEGGLFGSLVTIHKNAFNGAKFNKVTIGKNVINIAESAFNGATMQELVFETGGTEDLVLGNSAFNGVHGNIAVQIPARVKTLPQQIFYQVNITALTFEDGGENLVIANNAFDAFGTSAKTSTSASDTAYPFSAQSIVFPARLVSIGENAFQGQVYLKSISFKTGSQLTSIGKLAFAYTYALESLALPDSLVTIGDYAFASYWNGHKATLRDESAVTLTKADFASMASLTIPAKVTTIGQYAFYNRGIGLETLTFNGTADNADLSIREYSFAIHSNYTQFMGVDGNTKLTSVTFPANLVSVGGLFLNGAITSVTCQYLGFSTIDLSNCARLTTLGDNFMAGTTLTEVSIPASVTTIGNYVFANKITDNVNIVKTMQLSGKITLPAGLISLGTNFCVGAGVTEFEIASSNEKYMTVDGVLFNKAGTTLINYPFGKEGTSYKVPDGCTTIANGALKSNEKLTSIDFNDVTTVEGTYGLGNLKITSLNHSFASLGNFTFYNCAALTDVTINITGTTVPTFLFQNCTELVTVTLGTGITKLGNSAFNGCAKLTTINCNANITEIGQSTFSGCEKLTTANFGSDLAKIGNYAFDSCKELVSIDLSNVTGANLGGYAFRNAEKLASVQLGAITTIFGSAFENTSLTSLTLTSTTVIELKAESAFAGYSKEKALTIYVPNDLITSYQAAAIWKDLVEKEVIVFAAIPTSTTEG